MSKFNSLWLVKGFGLWLNILQILVSNSYFPQIYYFKLSNNHKVLIFSRKLIFFSKVFNFLVFFRGKIKIAYSDLIEKNSNFGNFKFYTTIGQKLKCSLLNFNDE